MRRRKKWEYIKAVVIVFVLEMLGAAAITAVAGAILIPLAYAERGYYAIGGEWALMLLIAVAAYSIIHKMVFHYAENGGQKNGRNRITREPLHRNTSQH